MHFLPVLRFCLAAALSLFVNLANADATSRYCPDLLAVKGGVEPTHRGEFTFSPFTHHWSQNPEH